MARKLVHGEKFGAWSLKIIFGILVFIVLSLFSWDLTVGNNSFYHCTQVDCQTLKKLTYSKKNDMENLDMSFRLVSSQSIYPDQNLEPGEINIFYKSALLTLSIPMRDGSSQGFPVVLSKHSDGNLIHIVIASSQDFSVFENNFLLYTHRYQVPVFFVDPAHPISNILLSHLVKLKFKIDLHHASINKSLFATTIYFLTAIYIGVALAIRNPKRPRKSSTSLKGFPFLFAIFLWIFSISKWLIQVPDNTGALRPGPFGPIGPFFSDIYQVLQAGSTSNPFYYNATDYPPFAVAIGQISRILPITLLVFVLLSTTVFLCALPIRELISTKTIKNNFILLGSLIFSYPILFGVLRGNFDLLAIALTLAAFYEYQNDRFGLTIIFLSLAIALKYWPILFIFIFIKNRQFKLTLKTTSLALSLSLISCAIFEHGSIKNIFNIITKPLFDYGSGANGLSSFAFSYSMGSIFLLLVMVLTARHPFTPTNLELQHSLTISQGVMHLLFIVFFLVVLAFLTKNCKRLSSLFLYISVATLLIPSTSATYRAGILIACLIVRALEGEKYIWRFMYQTKPKTIKKSGLQLLKSFEAFSWLFILVPSDFFYKSNTFFSTSSVLQPLSLCVLIVVEYNYDLQSQKTLTKKRSHG